MKYFIYLVAIIVLLGLNVGLSGHLKFLGAVPNMLLLFVVGASLQRDAEDSFFVAFCSGLFLDFYSGLLPGSFSAAFLLVALLLYVIIHKLVVFELSWKYLLAATAIATVFTDTFVWLTSLVSASYNWPGGPIASSIFSSRVPLEILYNAILAYFLYLLATWIKNLILSLQGKKYRIL